MPELPEVESARRGISAQLGGRTIAAVDLRLPKLIVSASGLTVDMLAERAILDARRHGKYLTLDFGDIAAVVHLKLSGQIVARGDNITGFAAGHPVPAYDAELPHKSTHLILTFACGATMYLTDIRHFARVQLIPAGDLEAHFAKLRLGVDAISPTFSEELFRQRLERRGTARLKPLLLDQTFIAGLGNIYVDEALHRAKLHPERIAGSMSGEETARLHGAIVDTMAIAVPIGGANILNGRAGTDVGEFPFVHGRKDLPCVACGATIVKERVNARGTYRCPMCQPSPD
ncbi:MAG TPA: DNA-formamidopyrimidine glycosylase family protein [Thermomicrobiales bacterium]|nr:DNA-formamidopyrimidine glycosylase family protein [Thermomicrobiales bacterium]